MKYTIFDIETDGLIENVTKIYCLSYNIIDERGTSLFKGSFTDYSEMRLFIQYQECLVGHNIIRYDIPVMEKILEIKFKKDLFLIDTLGLSWYLYPTIRNERNIPVPRRLHGLESWGEELGTKKVEIKDWQNLTIEEYIHRCEEDVVINTKLWIKQKTYLEEIYEGDDINRIINYLGFKLDCAREQEENPIQIDRKMCETYLETIIIERGKRLEELALHMPKNIKYKTAKKPKNMFKADGSISKIGEKWLSLLADNNIKEDVDELKVIAGYEDGNPSSVSQIKSWLFSLGWEPTIYKDSISKVTNEVKEVPQISEDGEICENIKKLYLKHPYLENLEGLTILNHRKGVFETFLESMDSDNKVIARIDGFTNTLRMQHRKPIANLTKVTKPWGKEIRSLLTVEDDKVYTLFGSDMTALEDTTKQHYMFFFDPEYVKLMRIPGFDPHLDLGVLAKLITQEESDFFKWYKKDKGPKTDEQTKRYHEIEEKRYLSKTTNFACVYGAGPPKISKTTGMPLDKAKLLHETYWKRNKAVKLVAKNVRIKTVGSQMWLKNPVSKFWYSLRVEKDAFSTLNQGTGVYCFDSWLRKVRNRGIVVSLQYHDEIMGKLKIEDTEFVRTALNTSIMEVDSEIRLNVPLGVSIDFGSNYSLIH